MLKKLFGPRSRNTHKPRPKKRTQRVGLIETLEARHLLTTVYSASTWEESKPGWTYIRDLDSNEFTEIQLIQENNVLGTVSKSATRWGTIFSRLEVPQNAQSGCASLLVRPATSNPVEKTIGIISSNFTPGVISSPAQLQPTKRYDLKATGLPGCHRVQIKLEQEGQSTYLGSAYVPESRNLERTIRVPHRASTEPGVIQIVYRGRMVFAERPVNQVSFEVSETQAQEGEYVDALLTRVPYGTPVHFRMFNPGTDLYHNFGSSIADDDGIVSMRIQIPDILNGSPTKGTFDLEANIDGTRYTVPIVVSPGLRLRVFDSTFQFVDSPVVPGDRLFAEILFGAENSQGTLALEQETQSIDIGTFSLNRYGGTLFPFQIPDSFPIATQSTQFQIVVSNTVWKRQFTLDIDGYQAPLMPELVAPGVLQPGNAYTIQGTQFNVDESSCSTIDITLTQGAVSQHLTRIPIADIDASFDVEVSIPAAPPGGSSVEAEVCGTVLASTDVTVLHSAEMVNDLFVKAFSRNPAPVNTTYWQTRTDKLGPELLGAMESAREEYESTQLRMELFTFDAHGREIVSPSGIAEDDALQARFTNAVPGEQAEIHLVFEGTIVKSETATVGENGIVRIDINVPNPLLPVQFDGPVDPAILDVIIVQGDRAESKTLTLREGPRLLLKSGELTEGRPMEFAVRGVAAEEEVGIVVRYDWSSGSREKRWIIGKTDGSNRLDKSNSTLPAPTWLRGAATRDGIEIDIEVGSDRRGYRATLLKGESREDIIAELIRTSGTSSIEAELSVLLTEEERILADQLLGDDWEGNAAEIGDALDEFIVRGGGFPLALAFGAANTLLISRVALEYGISIHQSGVLQSLLEGFGIHNAIRHQNESEAEKLTQQIEVARGWEVMESHGSEYVCLPKDCGVLKHHIGWDYKGEEGTEILSSVSGWVVDHGNSKTGKDTYGTMYVTIRVDLEHAVPLPLRAKDTEMSDPTKVVYITLGHLRPTNDQVRGTPSQRFNAGRARRNFTKFDPKEGASGFSSPFRLEVGDSLGFLEGFGVFDPDKGVYYFGRGTEPHLHVTMTTHSDVATRLAGVATESDQDKYLHPVKALKIIKRYMI